MRVLTFSRYSWLRECPEETSVMAMEDALSMMTTAFDCHLLQSAAVDRPLDVLGSAEQQQRLQTALSGRQAHVSLMVTGDSCGCQIPDWLRPVTQRVQTPEDLSAAASQWVDGGDDASFRWLHLELADLEQPAPWIAAGLQLAVDAVTASPDESMLVTSTGGEPADGGRFESLLWEGEIRVPLWIAGAHIDTGREPRPTGSYDVMETVLAAIGASVPSPQDDGPRDLSLVAAGKQDVGQRLIRIAGRECEAIRTAGFLLVRQLVTGQEGRIALYEKPQDVWNVHDVSHEYPQIVDDLLQQLPPQGTPGSEVVSETGRVLEE